MVRGVLVLAALLAAETAEAGPRDGYTKHDWPVQTILRPLTLAPDMAEFRGDTFVLSLSDGAYFEPFALAPDIFRGVTRRFTVGVVHNLGFCINDTGCGTVYNDVGLVAHYAVGSHGPAQLAARIGVQVPRFDRLFAGGRVGFTVRAQSWRLALLVEPTLYVGMIGRGDQEPTPEEPDEPDAEGLREVIEAPITIQIQLTSRGLFFLSSGLYGNVSGFSDDYQVPIGVGGSFAINHRVDLGAEFRFTNAAGPNAGLEGRTLFLRAAIRF